jgi:hypothetical protein
MVSSELWEFLRHKHFKWKHEIRFPPPKKYNASPLEKVTLNGVYEYDYCLYWK